MMVARTWKKHGLQPHRIEYYKASNDPDFEKKAADVIGLYMNPPQHAAVFCIDEKTAIQALDRVSTPCTCGSPFIRFPGGVLGRVDDMIQVRGVNVYPSAVESIIREEPAVVEFQVDISKERGMWELHIVVEVAPGADSEAIRVGVAEALRNRLGISATVEIAAPSSLPRYELKARRFRFKT